MIGLPLNQNAWRRSFFMLSDERRVCQHLDRVNETEMKACKVSVDKATSKGNRNEYLAVLADHSSGTSESYLGSE
jgi:hypothetical protein